MDDTEHRQVSQGTGGEPGQLRVVARRNELVLRRFQQHELALMSADSLHALLRALTAGTRESFGLDAVSLCLVDPGNELRKALERVGAGAAELPAVCLAEAPRWPEPGDRKPELGPAREAAHGAYFGEALEGIESVALLPLVRGDRSRGVLALGSRDPLRYQPHLGTDFLDHLSTVAAVCLENALNKERLLQHGRTDGLTGLYNRRYLQGRLTEEVARSHRHGEPLSCLFLDLDHFKRINDRYGHAAGDAVLRLVAERITGLLRASDVAVRYGGEELAVLLPHTGGAEALTLAERLRAGLEGLRPVEPVSGERLAITVSVGVGELRPGEDGAALLQAADAALYRAKANGRNRVEQRGDDQAADGGVP